MKEDFKNPSAPDEMSRREFIKKSLQIGAGVAIGSLGILESVPSAEKPKSPEIESARIEEMPDHNMPVGFKRFKITVKYEGQSQNELVGSFFSLEDEHSHATLLTRANQGEKQYFEPTVNFEAIAKDLAEKNKRVALQIAGAFTPDWQNIEGLALDEGRNVGQPNASKWRGLLVIENGNPRIVHFDDIEDFGTFWREATQKKYSLFQQIPVIHNGRIDTKPPFKADKEYEFRFFVERQTTAGISRGVVNLSRKMNIANALKVLQEMATTNPPSKISNALYLDSGAVSNGFFYDKDGKAYPMVDEQFQVKADGFTNLLTFYSQ